MNRRRFLGSVAGATVLAGCTGGDGGTDTTEVDTDGDGVPDSADYAPKDPDVQAKSDLSEETKTAATTTARPATTTVASRTETTTARETTTATPTATTTTKQTTSDPTTTQETPNDPDGNTLTVDWHTKKESHVSEYSSQSLTARVVPGGPSVGSDVEGKSVKLLGFAYYFPRGEAVAYGTSDPATLEGPTELTANVDLSRSDVAADARIHYMAFLMPGDVSIENVTAENLVFFHETDPFVLNEDGKTIERSPHPSALEDDSGEGYDRNAVEGGYSLSFEGSTKGQSWSVGFYIYKSTYVEAVQEPRGRSRPEYVAHAQKEGFADELAGILADDARDNGFTDKRIQVEFVVDFVQNLPYVPDDVSKGFDDYTKFIAETVTEAGGDCEDTAIMLAAVLQAEPFGYDMVLIQPPGHMAAGIYGKDDLPGVYWEYDGRKYYYIETTGEGWGIGDLPDVYEDADAYVHQV
jgi:hypothetical protein